MSVESSEPGSFTFQGPRGKPWLARFRSDGHADVWVQGRFEPDAEVLESTVPELASVRLEAPSELRILGAKALDLDALAPGPLELVIERVDDGRSLALLLTLEPGASRVIRWTE